MGGLTSSSSSSDMLFRSQVSIAHANPRLVRVPFFENKVSDNRHFKLRGAGEYLIKKIIARSRSDEAIFKFVFWVGAQNA